MSAYTRSNAVRHIDGMKYALVAPLIWHIGTLAGPVYEVEAGFEFDVSIPWWARWIFDPHYHAYHKAAALHDHMLIAGWNRMTAGGEFHEALKADGVAMWRRLIMFLAVVLYRYD